MKKMKKFPEGDCEWTLSGWIALPFEFFGRGFRMWIQTESFDGDGKVSWVRVWDYNKHVLYDLRSEGNTGGVWAKWYSGPNTTTSFPYDGTPAKSHRMTEANRQEMIKTMRLIIGFRQSPLPQEARDLWQGALNLVTKNEILTA